MVIVFAGPLRQGLLCVFECRTGYCCGTLNTVEPLVIVAALSRVISTSLAILLSLIDGCLKYNNKEKPKTGLRPGPRLNDDVNIGPKPSP